MGSPACVVWWWLFSVSGCSEVSSCHLGSVAHQGQVGNWGQTDVPASGVMVMSTVFGMVWGRSAYVDGAYKRVYSGCIPMPRGGHKWHCATKTT